MASGPAQSREFRSIEGPVVVDAEVARYYDEHPLQLAHDFPEEPQRPLWAHVGRVLKTTGRPSPSPLSAPAGGGGLTATLDAIECLHATGRLAPEARHRWAVREADRLLRARRLGLPQEPMVPLASDDEVRRARLRLVG